MSRIFVDSSVLYPSLASATGRARDLLLHAEVGHLQLICSATVTLEVERNLTAKAPPALSYFRTVQASDIFEHTMPPKELVDRCERLVHVKDAAIVADAIHSRAEWIATYDRRHLIGRRDEIHTFCGIFAATPDEILEALGFLGRP